MKVIHIIDSGGFYGAEVMLLNLCVEQIKQGLDVEVLSIGNTNHPPKAIETKLQEANVRCQPWRMRPLPNPYQSLKILNYCYSAKADLIHSHGYKGNILLGIIPKKIRRIPIVTTIHGYTRQHGLSKLAVYQWLDRQCLKHLDAVVLVSESICEQIPSNKLKSSLHVITNGIPEKVESSGAYESLFSDGQIKLGTLGRLSHEKNFSVLIDAMSLIAKRKPDAKLIIYGEGEARTELENKIRALNLSSAISLPGYLKDTHSFLMEIDIFINSSITEGMPISILEAMRAETNIIATKIPANVILLGNEKYVQQTCDISPGAIAEAILNLTNESPDALERQRKLNKELFLKNFTIEIMAKNYKVLYQTLV